MIGLKIDGLKEFPKYLEKKYKDIKFANAVALTWTAKDSQTEVRKSLADKFTLKNKFTQNGIRIIPADKKDDNPSSQVYSKDSYIVEHEEGGQRSISERPFVPISLREVFKIPANKVIPKSLRPNKLQNGVTVRGRRIFTGERSSRPGIYTEVEPFRIGKTGNELQGTGKKKLLYLQINKVKVPRKPWFKDIVDRTYKRMFQKNYDKAWEQYVNKQN